MLSNAFWLAKRFLVVVVIGFYVLVEPHVTSTLGTVMLVIAAIAFIAALAFAARR